MIIMVQKLQSIYDEELVLDKVQGLDELLKREKYNVLLQRFIEELV